MPLDAARCRFIKVSDAFMPVLLDKRRLLVYTDCRGHDPEKRSPAGVPTGRSSSPDASTANPAPSSCSIWAMQRSYSNASANLPRTACSVRWPRSGNGIWSATRVGWPTSARAGACRCSRCCTLPMKRWRTRALRSSLLAARAGAELGADIVKTSYTGDRESFQSRFLSMPVRYHQQFGDRGRSQEGDHAGIPGDGGGRDGMRCSRGRAGTQRLAKRRPDQDDSIPRRHRASR